LGSIAALPTRTFRLINSSARESRINAVMTHA
jgi:hypothetical protein